MNKKKSPARSSKKKRSPEQICADKLLALINETAIAPNAERVAVSKAMYAIRVYNMRKQEGVERELVGVVNRVRGKILKMLVDEIVQTEMLNITDVVSIMEVLMMEMSTLPMWEYEHGDEIDAILMEFMEETMNEEEPEETTSKKTHAKDVLKALSDNSAIGDGDD